jgi:hypothetical protein
LPTAAGKTTNIAVSDSGEMSILKAKLWVANIQGIHKRMVQFQTLTRYFFLTLHGHNVHRQEWQLSKFLMRYQQLLLMPTAGPVSKLKRYQQF